MLKKNRLTLLLLLLSVMWVSAQDTWSLQVCINYAQENSIAIKQAEVGVRNAMLTKKQQQLSRLPDLNVTVSGGVQFGRTIDPTTNSFDNQTIGFNRLSLSSGVTLSNGGVINNSIRQARVDAKIAQLDAADAANNLVLNIATAYLNILMADEQLQAARHRLELSQQQLAQVDKFIRAGVRPQNDRLNILATIAMDQQSVVQAHNAVELGYLQLKNLMLLDPGTNLEIEKPELAVEEDAEDILGFEAVYSAALQTQPQIRAANLRQESAAIGIDISKAGYYPTLSLFASLNSNWSSAARSIDGFSDGVNFQDVIIDGNTITVGFPVMQPNFIDYAYFDQISDNFGQSLGLSLNIPIYNNHRNRVAAERAQLNLLSTSYSAELTKQQLKNDVQSAIANARASRQSYAAARRSFEAANNALDNAEKRYELGSINTFEYTTARTNLETAQIEMIRSKFDYFFRKKIVDFYLGRPLKLD